jgi:hypothetical protein
VRARTGGLIDDPAEVGGYPELATGVPQADRDRDGMPDEWEQQHSLNPNDPADASARPDANGYTYLEIYLNSLPISGYKANEENLLRPGRCDLQFEFLFLYIEPQLCVRQHLSISNHLKS